MVNENFIPKTEEVRYLNTEIPTYEEFMKTYKSDQALEAFTEAEYQDWVLNGPQYGPGFWGDLGKGVASVALAASYFTPLGIVTIPATAVTGIIVATTEVRDGELDETGKFFKDITVGATVSAASTIVAPVIVGGVMGDSARKVVTTCCKHCP